jgi:uncharacterized membrane protein YkvA (DUF1232 family)
MNIREIINKPQVRKVIGGGALALSLFYLAYPSGATAELIPDWIPIIGHIDEATAVAILLWAFAVIRGKSITFGETPEEKQAVEVSPPEDVPPSDPPDQER